MYKEKELCVICMYVNAELSFRLIIWRFKKKFATLSKKNLALKN